jgi:hypothetical protein
LEPAPNYQLRIWNQPSRIGLIDEYSALFSIVPSAEDAFMFNSDPKQVVNETLKNDGQLKKNESSGDDQKPAEEVNKYKVITHNFVPGMPNAGSNINFINQKQGPSGSSTAIPPNIPTGIYALYPSISTKMSPTSFCALWTSAFLAIYIATL